VSDGGQLRVELSDANVVFTGRGDGDHEALARELGVRLVSGRQVHGARVVRVVAVPDDGATLARADGQATALRGLAPTVLTADCLPIALAGDGAVAMLHAGWRGLAAGVIAEGVRAVRELGAAGPLAAVIGPGAGGCCYEVGDEVLEVFATEGAGARRDHRLDLKAIARGQLARAGVAEVHDVELCTICSDPARFHSYRREGDRAGRQAGIAWLK
jgi:purine-nucleoside/S-methyl-5'-thioadenosine phosphorylase / adenosine deaminase